MPPDPPGCPEPERRSLVPGPTCGSPIHGEDLRPSPAEPKPLLRRTIGAAAG
jgi:hypothetical protein